MRQRPFRRGHEQLEEARLAARRGNLSRVRTMVRAAVLRAAEPPEVSEP